MKTCKSKKTCPPKEPTPAGLPPNLPPNLAKLIAGARAAGCTVKMDLIPKDPALAMNALIDAAKSVRPIVGLAVASAVLVGVATALEGQEEVIEALKKEVQFLKDQLSRKPKAKKK